jgi:predicted transcriptional regulator
MRIGLARRLIRDRRAAGLTQVELARLAEKGKLTPTIGTLQKIDRALEQVEQSQR